MFASALRRMQALVRASRYVMTVHGHEEMGADGLTIADVERVIVTGRVVERQRDRKTGEWKYLIEGDTVGGESVTVVARIGPTGRLVVITVYLSPSEGP